MDRLIIDPEFRDKIPPLTEDEFTLLEENILSDGAVFSPLIVWDGTILDGHNRYEIIQKHPELTYAVQNLDFDNRYEAISWICKHQLGRRNLTPQQKKYLIGQRYEAEKMVDAFHGNQHTSEARQSGAGQIDPHQNTRHVTRSRIAQETGTTDSYVKRAEQFAKGVDAAEEALPGIKQEILTGAIKPPETAVAAVAKAEPEERPRLAADLKKSKDDRDKKPRPAYHKAPPAASRKAEMQKIAEISAEMERDKAPSTEENVLCSLDGEIVSFMELFDRIFQEYPRLLSDSHYRQELIQIMQKMKQYIADIEGGCTE
ncbi:hypothetical protein [Anaerotruncus sp. 1XD42-93]|uniref:hypothetical protein n=1 Tax=Anaerotruncus sp. 1XD42-93 TaxID=2320853 RepID=UPI000EA285A4|nr:hypothetical protein [Anaerotruncus sp. 1XD42-93]NBK19221.1 hypothetical protein [Anaerotruncus sp. 1XD42-93]NCE75807.1 hypothetical protein [Anaerotruncus sp. X29]RKJ81866.1 hypothetical protein D7Y41_25070 [Anaerotruncus sp. 1XD22-93]